MNRAAVRYVERLSSLARRNLYPYPTLASVSFQPAPPPKVAFVPLINSPSSTYGCCQQVRYVSNESSSSGIAVVRKKGKGGVCYGCGADLVQAAKGTTSDSSVEPDAAMTTIPKKKGYWAMREDELKKSKIKNWVLCPRCKKLQKMERMGETIDVTALGPSTEMTQVFRQEVSKIRQKENAVVILCVDAINVSGTLISTIRNYVGGNPILVAITRCDLLPEYIWDGTDQDGLKNVYRELTKSIQPAAVYLCTEEPEFLDQAEGIEELGKDLCDHLNGRDPYVVGAANIGKSTLTDLLVTDLISKGEEEGHFRDRLARKRLEKLHESRVTTSALPGTTLQNVRVPCFPDHTQALWDTPGLLLDESLKHFPIRNFAAIRAQRPTQIEPVIFEENRNSFAVILCEPGDDLPLLRIEVRLKKNAVGEGPVRLVWNSILNLDAKIVDIDSALQDETRRLREVEQDKEDRRRVSEEQDSSTASLSKEERRRLKEERRKEYEKKVKREKAELGMQEYLRLERERTREFEETKRFRTLAQLDKVHEIVIERQVGMDITVANFGWLGILTPRTALVRTYAPSTGVRVSNHPTIGLPSEWGDFERPGEEEESTADEYVDEFDEFMDSDDFDDDYVPDEYAYQGYEDGEYGWASDMFDDEDYGSDSDDDESSSFNYKARKKKRQRNQKKRSWKEPKDIWERFSGKNIGWEFCHDGRFSKTLEEGWNPIRVSHDNEDDDQIYS